jgi:hypothetical protein
MIERMEPRRLFAAPAVVGVSFTGTADAVTSVTLTFGVPLDAASAQNVKAYSVTRKIPGKSSSFGLIPTGGTDSNTRRVGFVSAAYNPATQTVILTPAAAFNMYRKFRRINIDGTGANAVKDAAGAPIDGDGNGKPGGNNLIHARLIHSNKFTFKEADGDSGHLKLNGPGKIVAFADQRKDIAPIVFLTGSNALQSTLTGSVTRGHRGDGVVTIGQLVGTTFASVPILANPAFVVEVVNP